MNNYSHSIKKTLAEKKVGVRFVNGKKYKDTLPSTTDTQSDLTPYDIDVIECLDSEDELDFVESLMEENV